MFNSKLKIFAVVLFVVSLAGCAAVPVQTTLPAESLLLKDMCTRYGIEWQWDSVSQIVTLESEGKTAKAMVGSDLIVVEGEQINLSAPLKRDKGMVMVPADFKWKVVDRLIKKVEYVVQKFQTIIIDAGHGGKDPGTSGRSGLKEKTVVLDIALKLRNILRDKGIKVIMTRDTDEFIALEDRAKIANKSNADLFISIHANYSRTRSVRGMEVYYLRNLDDITRRDTQLSTNYKEALGRLAMKKGDATLDRILLDLMYENKQIESRKIAKYVTKNTSDDINSVDRGSKMAGFSVLKNTLIPAVLVEVGFLSNKSEEDLLSTSSYREQVAESLAKSILEYADKY